MSALLIIGVLIILVSLVWLNYSIGYKKHIKKEGVIKYPRRSANLTLFTDGNELYERYFNDLRLAKKSVEIQFYRVNDDAISTTFFNLLQEKAQEGVQVRILLDWYGSSKVKDKAITHLKEAGVKIAFSHKPRLPFLVFTALTHNHRKITVIDGTIGYIGGFNIGEECRGNDPKLGYWRDYHLLVEGKGVDDLRNRFCRDWNTYAKEKMPFIPIPQAHEVDGEVELHFESTNGTHLQDTFLSLVKMAKKELLICSPYFIPGKELTDELIKAINRGVEVKVLVPFKGDYILVSEAAFRYFGKLLPHGCKIYRFYQGFCHSKVIVVDNELCDIGSGNFNKRSFYLNDEINAFIHTPSFINMVKETIYEDIRRSEQLTFERYQNRTFLHKSKEQIANAISLFL